AELAIHLKRRRFDMLWTQWPDLESYSTLLLPIARALGIKIVHTVHNVVPHESGDRDARLSGQFYRHADLLFVHSEAARRELAERFPDAERKAHLARHGLYNFYPRFEGDRTRLRAQLGLDSSQVAALFAGGIRPYKNIDSALEALTMPGCERVVLVVA